MISENDVNTTGLSPEKGTATEKPWDEVALFQKGSRK